LVPSFDGGDDAVGIGGPSEGLWIIICLGEEAIDGGLEIDDGAEDAAFQSTPGKLGKEALDGIEPGARGWREVEDEALVPVEPGADLRMLVGGVIVEDDVDYLAGRHLGFDRVQDS
jgi:hypothetical protein